MPIFTDLSKMMTYFKIVYTIKPKITMSQFGLIWKKVPKDIFVGHDVLEIGVWDAVINFNDGLSGLLDVFTNLNLDHGGYTQTFCIKHDEKRINSIDIKCLAKVKQRRKRLRAI